MATTTSSPSASASPNPPLKPTDQEKIRRLVLLGASARELADEFGISLSNAIRYVRRWQQELQAVRQDERELARGLIVNQYRKAEELYEMAKAAVQPPPAGKSPQESANGRESTPSTALEAIPSPNFDAMAKALDIMGACAQKLGEFSRSIGTTGVAQIKATSEENLKAMDQSFAIDHPDRIPGLGFNPVGGPGGFGQIPGQNGQPTIQMVMVMPKTVEGERLERERLGIEPGAGPGPGLPESKG